MENILPRNAYDRDENGYWKRLPLVAGTGFGLPFGIAMALAFLLIEELTPLASLPPIALHGAVIIFLVSSTLGGLLFAIFFPIAMRRKVSLLVDALYNGDPKIDVPPPAGKHLRHRLPCGWAKTDNFAVGGVLYIGDEGLLFVPHKQNLAVHRGIVEMAPLSDVSFSIVEGNPNSLSRLLLSHVPRLLEVKWPGV